MRNTRTITLVLCLLTCLMSLRLQVFTVSCGADEVGVAFGDRKAPAQDKALTMQVVATGVGLDPEQAKQNAFSAAIEQAVGVLVDAKTIVENDQIVTDQVLTVSRGFVEEFKPVRSWEKDGLHYVRIQATVAMTRLADRLAAHKMSVRDVEGELMYRQAKQDIKNAETAADMFYEVVQDFKMDALVQVQIQGTPTEISKDDVRTTLQVNYILTPDMANWRKFYGKVTPFLRRLSSRHTTFQAGQARQAATKLAPETNEICLAVFKRMSATGQTSEYDVYVVPKTLAPVWEGARDQPFKVHVALVDETNRPLAEADIDPGDVYHPFLGKVNVHYLGPVFCSTGAYDDGLPSIVVSNHAQLTVELEQLKHVTKCVAYLKNMSPLAEE